MPGWLMTILFTAGFAALLGFGYWVLATPRRPQPAASKAAPPPMETPITASPAVQASPVLRNIEITGLRLVEDTKQKAVLQFLVVNHSAADLGEVSAKGIVRTVGGKPEQPPLTTFAFKTSLGPYEAKDLKVPIETKLRVYELPDWQFLRAEVSP